VTGVTVKMSLRHADWSLERLESAALCDYRGEVFGVSAIY